MKRPVLVLGLAVGVLFVGALFAGPVEEQIAKAKSLYNSGKFLEAAQTYKSLLTEQKEVLKGNSELTVEVWQGFGESLLRAGKKDEAQKAFDRVSAHKSRKTISNSTDAVSSAMPQTTAGTTPKVVSQPGTVVEELKSSTNPEVKELYRNALGFLAQGGSRTLAIMNLLEAVRKEPDNPDLLSKGGLLIVDYSETYLKNAHQMLTHLNQVKKGKLTDEEKIGLAKVLFQVAPFKYDEAGALLAEVSKTDPKNVVAMLAMSELDLARGKFDKALEGFNKVKTLNPKDGRAFWGVGYAYLGMGKKDEAKQAFFNAFDRGPEDAALNAKMGKAMLAMGKESFAAKYFSQALSLDPDNIDANLGYIPILLKTCEDMTARQYLNRVMEIDPGNPKLYLYKGMWNEMRLDLPAAVNNYELSAAYGPDSVDAKMRLARIFLGIGHPFPGKLDNTDPAVKKNYNLFYSSSRALTILKEVMEVAPNHPEIGWITETVEKLEAKRQFLKD